MDGYFFLFTGLKILVVLLFAINTAALLTWGERRQSAMIQDRIGPNRAVIFLPGMLLKVIVALVGVGLAGSVANYAWIASKRSEAVRLDVGFVLTELAVLLAWMSLIIARRVERKNGGGFLNTSIPDARVVLFAGLLVHVLVAALRMGLTGNEADRGGLATAVFHFVGPVLAALLLAGGALVSAIRIPNGKVGLRLGGMLHALADGAKMAFKEDFIPPNADRLLHSLGPIIALFPAFVVFAVIPFGDTVCIHPDTSGHFWADLFNARIGDIGPNGYNPYISRFGICSEGAVPLQVANLNVGILYMFALAGTGIIGAAIAGWSSDNKFSLLGGLRASSQMVSYEVAMGLSLVGAFMTYGSVRLDDMVRWQSENAWGIFVQPFAFFLFLAASIAENKRVPFDAPEGESEIVAGYYLEYSGFKFGMFMFGEYIELAVSSAVLVTIFFGGYALPFLHRDGITIELGETVYYHLALSHRLVIVLGVIAFFLKTWITCWGQLFIRWTVPRFRYDQIMKLGWRFLLPSALVNVVITGVILLGIDAGGTTLGRTLDVLADASQGFVLILGVAMAIALASGILAPPRRRTRAVSSSATFAEAAGGTRTSPMQA
ncbi:MAG TPA: complex I subunit 1 family protein [Polyangiaceae bacterium]|nr:complex I subunit 1 family protein [Polyangiaceae bacterium]